MANGNAHRLGAGLAVATAIALSERQRDEATARPIIGGGLAAFCGKLPDVLEPVNHPNHRQIFHSVLALGTVAWGMKKAYEWEPDSEAGEWVRFGTLCIGAAYIVHLLMDGCTPKSLPMIGKV